MAEIIPVHAHIETAGRHVVRPDLAKQLRDASCKGNSAALDTDEDDFDAVFVALRDFVGDAGEDTLDRLRIKDGARFGHKRKKGPIRACRNLLELMFISSPWQPHRAALKERSID